MLVLQGCVNVEIAHVLYLLFSHQLMFHSFLEGHSGSVHYKLMPDIVNFVLLFFIRIICVCMSVHSGSPVYHSLLNTCNSNHKLR